MNKKNVKKIMTTLVALFTASLLMSCEEIEEMRVYQEPVPKEDGPIVMSSVGSDGSKPIYDFTAPNNWIQTKGDAMRILSFATPAGNDIAVTFLGGLAGSVEANLIRWAGQIEIELDAQSTRNLISQAQPIERNDGTKGKIYDFTPFLNSPKQNSYVEPNQNGNDKQGLGYDQVSDKELVKSIWAAIFEQEGGVLFVKVMGPIEAIKEEANDLKAFSKSLTYKDN